MSMMLGKRLIIAASALVGLNAGFIYTWPRGLFALVKDGKVQISLSVQEQIYIVNSLFAFKLIGSILTAYLMEKRGRRMTQIVLGVINLAGWVPNFVSATTWSFCLSQAFHGVFINAFVSVIPVVVGETIEPSTRGVVITVSCVTSTIGTILVSLLSETNYLLYNAVPVIPSVSLVVLTFMLHETPHFSMIKDGKDKAREQIVWLRGHCNEGELSKMEENIHYFSQNSHSYKDLFRQNARKSIGITVLFVILSKLAGNESVANLVPTLLPNSSISSSTAIVIISSGGMCSNTFALFFIDRVGRKPLSFVSYVGAGISFFIAATWYLLNDILNEESPTWIPLCAFASIEIFSNLGSQFLHHILIGELFSPEVRGRASTVVTVVSALTIFLYNQALSWFIQFLSNAGALYICFAFHVIAIIFVYTVLFETKGKTLEEIQDEFSKKNHASQTL